MIEFAKNKWDVELKPTGNRILLLGPNGCIAAPHLRPLCTIHTCEIASLGFKKNDTGGVWTEKYFALRGEISDLEY